ncbi:MAG: hypothetical protein H5T86_00550 [Armatimonadetes bacterium]|nr:hypothetical protein [Armatimonadota bacterium]
MASYGRMAVAIICAAAVGQAAGEEILTCRVPLMTTAPRIDGLIDSGEWKETSCFSGFAWENRIVRRRAEAYIGATREAIYVAIKSELPARGGLLTAVDVDTVKIVYDDSVEVWIDPTPGSEHGRIFQMLANAAGRTAYKMHARGNVPEDVGWKGHWQVANGLHDGWWHCEIAIPVVDVAPGRDVADGEWGINVCRNWKRPWQFSSLGGGPYPPENLRFKFCTDAPAAKQYLNDAPFAGPAEVGVELFNPTNNPLPLVASVVFAVNGQALAEEKRSLELAPGERAVVAVKGNCEVGRLCEAHVSVTSRDGKQTYCQRALHWESTEQWTWIVEEKARQPMDVQFAYYPYLNRMRALIDLTNLPPSARVQRLEIEVRENNGGRVVKRIALDNPSGPRVRADFNLPPISGSYELSVRAAGENVPQGEVVKRFERRKFEWERLGLGTRDRVWPPFTPIRLSGRQVSVVLRRHMLTTEGLWEQVFSRDKPLLAAPMRLVAEVSGERYVLRGSKLKVVEAKDTRLITESALSGGPLRGLLKCTWDYDGLMRVDLTLQSSSGQRVDALRLEIPIHDAAAPMYHAMGDGIRNTLYARVPPGEGVVWTSEKVQTVDFPANFCTYIYVGSPVRGLCWFAENDAGWSWDRQKPNADMTRQGDTLTLRVHLINEPIVIDGPRQITFGLLAAPVKPRIPDDWRHRWRRAGYTLLGTDINWFALGDCGSVYPAGKDMYLWEMLAQANERELTEEEVQSVIERGRKYFEPYGPECVESFVRHVRYNLRARRGMKMVFYYNRASYQAAEEFQTFQDEWCLTDYRTLGEGNGIGEIKIVPTDSYIDHALYWYGKSFDIARNQGVYWDNWFFVASYNTVTTGAYYRPDGSIMPSTGIWGLRELAKRTFQYMNERGMFPLTMAHMTSTGILPMLSFCTVQYDWEWKYSEGDVQYRFPREYILLVSNGELAGTWPVLLNDHGALADDPWTGRTFAAVAMVHELDCPYPPWTKTGKAQLALFQHVDEMLSEPDLQVFRYWDDEPQPVVASNPDVLTIVYVARGKRALCAAVSYAEQDVAAELTIDASALGLANGFRVVDAETGKEMAVEGRRLPLEIREHDIRMFWIMPPEKE